MNSLYLWTGIEPPTGPNLTNWMTGPDIQGQKQIRDARRYGVRLVVGYRNVV